MTVSSDLQAFLLEPGRALSLAGTWVSETQERLTAVAAASGVGDARVVVLPTALMIAFGRLFGGDVSGFFGQLAAAPPWLRAARGRVIRSG